MSNKTEIIRALWWKQPYASLMLHGKIETRTYPTNVRGKVLICATIKPYSDGQMLEIAGLAQFMRICEQTGFFASIAEQESYGKAIAIGELVDCRPMQPSDADNCFVQYRKPVSRCAGNVSSLFAVTKPALWCWVFADVRRIEPFEIKGKQGWAILDEETKSKIKII